MRPGGAGPDEGNRRRGARLLRRQRPRQIRADACRLLGRRGPSVATFLLGGTLLAGVAAGGAELIRGRIDILNRRFDLDEGRVQLLGDFDPYIRFVAMTETDDGTAGVVVEGRASSPEVRFTATPDIPQDEVLAKLLYGRDLSQLSAFQALELAIGQSRDRWEPDGDGDDDYAGTTVETIEWEDHSDAVAPDPAPARPRSTPEIDDSPDFPTEDDTFLDEDSLRELVADIVRQELMGALGERITRNVRKLVRREIHRALTAQDLD